MRLAIRIALLLAALAGVAQAAPRVPDRDDSVIERLPVRATDPLARELRQLRAALAADPSSVTAAVQLARRYFDLASAEGDPRYIGYAEAVLRPWTSRSAPPAEVILLRALLRQYRHGFDVALADLDTVLVLQPDNTEAMQWRFALHLALADYAAARADCDRLAPHASPLAAAACVAVIDSLNGRSREAYASLSGALARQPTRDEEYRQWVLTRLAEMALRLGDRTRAEAHFRQAIATGITDGFVLAAYADLLLEAGRPAEVVPLLKAWVASDVLLLRLAIAEDAVAAPDAARHAQALAERFAAAALRGDTLHQQEEARFWLQLRHDPARAVALAAENWQRQREPRDALVLLEAALAAGQPAAATPALDWLARTGYEDPRYRALGAALRKAKR